MDKSTIINQEHKSSGLFEKKRIAKLLRMNFNELIGILLFYYLFRN
jgi:hypothetical protein